MRVELNLSINEIDQEFIELLKTLLKRNAEVVIKQQVVALDEYPADTPLDKVMAELSGTEYNAEFLADLEQGLKKSSVYAK
jgi:hypothetical protein